MELLFYILGSTFIISLLGLIGIFSLKMKEDKVQKIIGALVPFAAGTLMGGALFHLLPESAETLGEGAFAYAIAGFAVFMIVESYFHYHACHECEIHPYTYVMLIGDAIHNIIDGIAIAASYFAGVQLGIVTTFVIWAHEFPQQLGLFGVLLHGKVEKGKAIIYSYLAQLTVIVGGILGFLLAGEEGISYPLMGFAAGGFIYVAASDLVPEIHKSEGRKRVFEIALLLAGVLLMYGVKVVGLE